MTLSLTEPLPLRQLSPADTRARITELKRVLGRRLVILGHHYQVDEVIEHADMIGDSFKLARFAADRKDAEFIVFAGVHFMAESADILTGPDQTVILPDLSAGCSMADMANVDQVETAFAALQSDQVMPITYMNSSAAIKAFCGRHGGAVCTSSNAEKLVKWSLSERPRMLFLPDQHLGRNICHLKLGIPLSEMALWDPHRLPEENLRAGCDRAKIILWKGHCSVHTKFLPAHVDQVRARDPSIKVIVHPECYLEVVQKSDAYGSTEKLIQLVEQAAPGASFAIGTEINLVSRIAKAHPDKKVVSLSGINCLCATMYRIDAPHLLWTLENLAQGVVVNPIRVDEQTAAYARLALERMLSLI